MEKRRLENIRAIGFIKAGKSHVTLKSLKTGKHYTYRITKSKDGNVWFVGVLYNPNDSRYQYLGLINKENEFKLTYASRLGNCSSFAAFKWAWNHIVENTVPDSLEIWHEGRCGRCGRRLTDPTSIETGYGPHCRGAV